MAVTQHPSGNPVSTWSRRRHTILSRLSALVSSIWDEGLRLVLWWGLLMVSMICVLELCRWFWLVYPETVIGKKYIAGADEVPAFAHLVLHEPHWHTALYLVTAPALASLILAFGSRFCYLKRLFYNPFAAVLRTLIWAAPVAAWTGYYITTHTDLDFTLEAAIICAAGPSLALIPLAFRTADRLSPELGDCIRWVRRSLRQLRREWNPSKRLGADKFQEEGVR